jgi:hypothetical protein
MGERARSIGSEAETKAWKFLQNLGYKIEETNIEEYNIDCLAVFSPAITNGGLVEPCYAPHGLTAFEVTEESFRKKKVTDFKDKILRYNNDNPTDRIDGGVLMIDQRVSVDTMSFMKNEGIWGWGHSRLSLYKQKLRIFHEWKDIYLSVSEISIDKNCSYLRSSTPPPTKSDKLLYFAIFFDDDFHKLSAKRTTEILSKIREDSLLPLMRIGISPINIHIEFHSVGGVSISDEDFEQHLARFWRTEGINIITARNIFSDYRTFPAVT